jgi:hypothetical protein
MSAVPPAAAGQSLPEKAPARLIRFGWPHLREESQGGFQRWSQRKVKITVR